MPQSLIEAMVNGLRKTSAFTALPLPAMTRPLDELWHAHNQTLLALRQPLYHAYLGKRPPTAANFQKAIQIGLTELGVFAELMDVKQAIIRFERGWPKAISFQPRPHAANWTATHGLSPESMANGLDDPLSAPGKLLAVTTADMLHLGEKVARAFIASTINEKPDGTTTIDFIALPLIRLTYRRISTAPGESSTVSMEYVR